MKKLISFLMVATIITQPISHILSCGTNNMYSEIWMIANDGYHDDKSFTEYVYKGADDFVKKIIGLSDYDAAYSEMGEIGEASLKTGYENAVAGGAKTLVLSGYSHDVVAKGYFEEVIKKVNGSAVIIDNKTYKEWTSTVGIQYRAEISGFYAGLSSIIWSIINGNYKEFEDHKELGLATFGGLLPGNENSVINFMAGFLTSVDVWNEIQSNKEYSNLKNNILSLDQDNALSSWFSNKSNSVKRTQNDPKSDNDSIWQSGSYTAGKGKDLSNTLINNGANILLPVAGPQTEDALSILKNDPSKKCKLIGVDIDVSNIYTSYENLILTSATKELTEGGIIGIGHTQAYKDNAEYQDKVAKYANDKDLNVYLFDEATRKFSGEKVNFDSEKGKSWQGKTAWLSGDASSGNNNLISDDIMNKIKLVFSKDLLLGMSNFYYENSMFNVNKKAYELLEHSFTEKMSSKVLESLKNS
ncbi:hypothetical protein [Spiroplasma turonicum]|uniref:Ribose/galactose ABC transporter substrate-binding protein n=1 Tax=Spiroplasma turonicum TaxID=216946 RepID=A0A0K1P640_9MOLU|nr:hypothetical protein [Spiroplasma turonicum]AKU79644.1 ribose/galactose ABC transporter substrate-binding protein [Spiroplasma turonicum]ALX70665.1 hypothetical protein STURO_v1c03970 [Spiroplasma turonicum]